jgi:hypothetical protein
MIALLFAAVISAHGQPTIEEGIFHLHKIAQPIGVERYTISADSAGGQRVDADFAFTDRNTRVPLLAVLRARADGTPYYLKLTGNVSRESKIDVTINVRDTTAEITNAGAAHTQAVPGRTPAFTIDGYAPVILQQELLRYWLSHGLPDTLATLPAGAVRIARRGVDTLMTDAGTRILTRCVRSP